MALQDLRMLAQDHPVVRWRTLRSEAEGLEAAGMSD
jgi:hypothetical protein